MTIQTSDMDGKRHLQIGRSAANTELIAKYKQKYRSRSDKLDETLQKLNSIVSIVDKLESRMAGIEAAIKDV